MMVFVLVLHRLINFRGICYWIDEKNDLVFCVCVLVVLFLVL